ncbi:uncharacterized protein B0J16DRAFT_324024 [Fusarium flagelliforme]|uniref:uncharacterized protein n=1 Tax=Fusarium flagelliforme TaxID=2675880 RepID=UPI001E8DFE55|nr:uncharacterized protein B0J16DRAFT_324024 [Fusarium flagelliforme]KAH7174567.1 hypothetical protein B0J16DRAFT_324024 [Fusarium flagelliforme]
MDRASLQHETITDRDANLSRDFLNSMTLEALMLSAIELKLQFGSARNLSTRIRPWDWSNRLHSCNLRNLQNCTQVKADGVERVTTRLACFSGANAGWMCCSWSTLPVFNGSLYSRRRNLPQLLTHVVRLSVSPHDNGHPFSGSDTPVLRPCCWCQGLGRFSDHFIHWPSNIAKQQSESVSNEVRTQLQAVFREVNQYRMTKSDYSKKIYQNGGPYPLYFLPKNVLVGHEEPDTRRMAAAVGFGKLRQIFMSRSSAKLMGPAWRRWKSAAEVMRTRTASVANFVSLSVWGALAPSKASEELTYRPKFEKAFANFASSLSHRLVEADYVKQQHQAFDMTVILTQLL